MRTPPNRFRRSQPGVEREIVTYTDDGGSGLLEACKRRFAAPKYEVACDARHTVWVRSAEDNRSFGLSPWLLRTHSMSELLSSTEAKLRLPSG